MLIIFLTPFFSVGQPRYEKRELNDVDQFIQVADSLAMRSQTNFVLTKFLKGERAYKERWNYLINRGKIVLFEVNYIIDSSEYAEIYYVDKNNLVCSEEYETANSSYLEDELKWGGIYYFVSAVPRRIVTLGKKKTIEGTPEESLVYNRFRKRYAELKMHLPMLP